MLNELDEIIIKAMMNDPKAIQKLFALRELGYLNKEQPKAVVPQRKIEVKLDDDLPLWEILERCTRTYRRKDR